MVKPLIKKLKSCNNYQKYPLCKVLGQINKILDEGIIRNAQTIKAVFAQNCDYFKDMIE